MLDLDSDAWVTLTHAYGSAVNIPELLRHLAEYPEKSDSDSEPFFSLWSALCHQGDTCDAAYAAVPHILNFAVESPTRISFDYLLLPASIEIARASGRGPEIPEELKEVYLSSLVSVPMIVGGLSATQLDESWCLSCAGALAAAGGHHILAEAILALEGEGAREFLEWFENQ